MYKYEKKTHRK